MKKTLVMPLALLAFAGNAQADCCSTNKKTKKQTVATRRAKHHIDDFFVARRSLYAMSGQEIQDEELFKLFEAARWAPSSFNAQPWRFIYAKRNTNEWNLIHNLLVDFNKKWTNKASALVLVLSRNNFEFNNNPNRNHSFDTGAAWENIALQAHLNGLVAHGMSGFDFDRARTVFEIPNDYTVEMIFAVGKRGTLDDLPDDMKTIEDKPSDRKPVEEIAFVAPGPFKK